MNIRKALNQMNEEFGSHANRAGPSINFSGTPSFGDKAGANTSGRFDYYAGIGAEPPVFEYPAQYNFQRRNPQSIRQALLRMAGAEEEFAVGDHGMVAAIRGGQQGMSPSSKRRYVNTPGQVPAHMDMKMAMKMTGFADDMQTPESLPGRPQEISQQDVSEPQAQMARPAGHPDIPKTQLIPKYIPGKGQVQIHPEDIRMHYTRRAALSSIERNHALIKNLLQFGGGNQNETILKMIDANYELMKHATGIKDKEPIPAKIRSQLANQPPRGK